MQRLTAGFDRVDARITRWMARYGIVLLRVSLGINFLWFGALKLFPGLSPAEALARRTIGVLTFGLVDVHYAYVALAVWECLVGVGLVFGVFVRVVLLLLLAQMVGAMMPLFLFPELAFTHLPYAPTLEGQYIIKNLVLVSAALVIGATVRGGRVVHDPAAPLRAEPSPRPGPAAPRTR